MSSDTSFPEETQENFKFQCPYINVVVDKDKKILQGGLFLMSRRERSSAILCDLIIIPGSNPCLIRTFELQTQ